MCSTSSSWRAAKNICSSCRGISKGAVTSPRRGVGGGGWAVGGKGPGGGTPPPPPPAGGEPPRGPPPLPPAGGRAPGPLFRPRVQPAPPKRAVAGAWGVDGPPPLDGTCDGFDAS